MPRYFGGGGGANFQRSIASDDTLGAPSTVTPIAHYSPPTIATNGDNYLLVFAGSEPTCTVNISGRLLDGNGLAGAPFPNLDAASKVRRISPGCCVTF